MPALFIVIDEYAELAEEAPEALHHADTIARLGSYVAYGGSQTVAENSISADETLIIVRSA